MLGELELMVLLAILRIGEDAHGMDVHHEIETRARRRLAPPTVYTTLARLEAKALLASRLGDPTPRRGGRARRAYSLTFAGRVEVAETAAALQRMMEGVVEL